MFSQLFLYLLVAVGGAALTLQMAFNAKLRTGTGSPVLTILVSIFVSFTSLSLVWLSGIMPRGSMPAFNSLPKWAWFGGVFSVYYLVMSLIAIPRLGAAVVFSLVIAGQMIGAVMLDSTGAFGLTQIPLTASRLIGIFLLLTGVFLIQKR